MKKLALIALALIGCQQTETGQMQTPDAVTSDGVVVYNKSDIENLEIPPKSHLHTLWEETKSCTSLEAEPPPVLIVDDIRDYCLTGAQGGYCEIDGVYYVLMLSDRLGWDWLWRHEFIHHLQLENGIADPGHESEAWACQSSAIIK